MSYKDFTEMPVWQQSFELLVPPGRDKTTKNYPSDERFGLISDMRRSANSIAHNIAEGFGRFESKDKTRFYEISRGSTHELISQILVSVALSYINEKTKNILVESAHVFDGIFDKKHHRGTKCSYSFIGILAFRNEADIPSEAERRREAYALALLYQIS
jgi:four helix bundle protein